MSTQTYIQNPEDPEFQSKEEVMKPSIGRIVHFVAAGGKHITAGGAWMAYCSAIRKLRRQKFAIHHLREIASAKEFRE